MAVNQEQRVAIRHNRGPVLVVAGAGTGKTKVITERIVHLIKDLKISPHQILAVTFTDKAAEQMQDRVSELLGTLNIDVNITTFNSFGDQILRRFALDIGLNSNLKLMSEIQQLVFLGEHIDDLKLDYYAPITRPEGMLKEISRYFSSLKNNLITPKEYRVYLTSHKNKLDRLDFKRHQELAVAYTSYLRLCRIHNVIDFDDQIYLTLELLRTRPNIRRKLQQEYSHLLVDEYQDTNLAQDGLIDLLSGSRNNIMVVGDDDQCIYNFRGAAISNILAFRKRYPRAKQVALVRNYRSSQAILDAAYRLIQYNNPNRLEAKYKINKCLKGQFKGAPPEFKRFNSYEEEAGWIAKDIKRRLKRGEPAAGVAILLRKNSQAGILQKYLETEGVDHLVVGDTLNLYQQPEIKLLLMWLRVVVDPHDSESLYHLLVSDVYKIDSAWLRGKVSLSKKQRRPLEEILKDPSESLAPQLAEFLDHLKRWRTQLPKVSVGRLAYLWLKDTGYLHKLLARAKDEPAVDQKIANLNQFFSGLAEFGRIATDDTAVGYLANLPNLLERGERLQIEDLPELYGQKVPILTVHKAKGLEFDTVYVFDLTQGTFPSTRRTSSLELPPELLKLAKDEVADSGLQEERRLLYVAMTRAKQNLILSFSFDHGGRRAKKPSIFLAEIFGPQVLADTLVKSQGNIGQIELFRPVKSGRSAMPWPIVQGDQIILTTRQIEDYLRCPAEFYFRHILAPPLPPSFALDYGTLIHGVIQLYNQRRLDGATPKVDELIAHIEAGWPREGFHSAGHERRSRALARRTIQRFYKRQQTQPHQPNHIEQPFKLELPEAGLTVKGRFDAVYENDKGVEIRDYKTGGGTIDTQAKADKRAAASLQLAIYGLAWYRIKGQLPDELALDFVDSGLIGTARKTQRQLVATESKIMEAADKIRAGDFRPGSSHLYCFHQDYGL